LQHLSFGVLRIQHVLNFMAQHKFGKGKYISLIVSGFAQAGFGVR
jgi:hypothetical protein